MKKYLPLIIFLLGLAVLGGVFFFVMKAKKAKAPAETEEVVSEIPFDKRPIARLIPSEDGHWLKMVIDQIKVDNAVSLDYELLYKVGDGRTQGVPGTVKLEGKNSLERDLLLGSESSGKFRYDAGVEEGTFTLRFRNDKGKLVGKLSTEFHLQTGGTKITSVDEKFSASLAKSAKGVYFVTMEVFGRSAGATQPAKGPYGVFASDAGVKVTTDGWEISKDSNSSTIGIFYSN